MYITTSIPKQLTRLSLAIVLGVFSTNLIFAEPIVLDQTKQLFLDDDLIATQNNTQRIVHKAHKHSANPILEADSPWEDDRCVLYGSVIQDNNKFRMWYLTYLKGDPSKNKKPKTAVAYAESTDGIHWKKPKLDLVTIAGKQTNVLFMNDQPNHAGHPLPYFAELLGVHKDPHSNRYLMGFLSIQRDYTGSSADPFHTGQRRGLGVATSQDGLNWELVNSFTTDSICDGDTHWMFDHKQNRHVLFGRTKQRSEKLLKAWAQKGEHKDWIEKNYWGRVVARTQSADFVNWKHKQPATAPVVMTADERDEPGTEIYSQLVFPYESTYISLIQIFHNRPHESTLDFQLALSRDSVHFERVGNRETFLPCGQLGDWDRFNQSIANNPPIRVGNELRFYYSGRSYRHGPYAGNDRGVHKAGIGFASIPVDRFVSIAGSYNDAQLTTKPLLIKNKNLYLNLQSNFGKVVTEILDKSGQVLAKSIPIRADNLHQKVEWQTGALPTDNTPVRLRFHLENAHLYAFWSE